MKLLDVSNNITLTELKTISLMDSIHFDIREFRSNITSSIDKETGDTLLTFRNPPVNWFALEHNRYFTINTKSYWFAANKIDDIRLNQETGDVDVILRGRFVTKAKSLSWLDGRDTRGQYQAPTIIDVLAETLERESINK